MKILLVANTGWYLYNFRLLLAQTLRDQGHEVVLVSPPDDYTPRLQAAGFRWLPVEMSRRGTRPLQEARALLRLLRLYRQERPQLINHFTIKPVLYGSLAARLARIPRVVNSITGAGYVFYGSDRKSAWLRVLLRPVYRLAMRASQVIFQNETDREAFIRAGMVKTEQAHLIPSSGVDTRRFQASPLPPGPPVVLFAGRMLWPKGVGEFVEAARILRGEGSPARFWLVGNSDAGNPEHVSAEQLRQWQSEGIVEWLGWQEDMPAIIARAWVVCLPTRYGEGFPRRLLEGAASGRAVITSDAPGCAQAVVQGETGLVVPHGDPAAFAAALRELLPDARRLEAMGTAGRRFVEERFSADIIINRTMAVYFS